MDLKRILVIIQAPVVRKDFMKGSHRLVSSV